MMQQALALAVPTGLFCAAAYAKLADIEKKYKDSLHTEHVHFLWFQNRTEMQAQVLDLFVEITQPAAQPEKGAIFAWALGVRPAGHVAGSSPTACSSTLACCPARTTQYADCSHRCSSDKWIHIDGQASRTQHVLVSRQAQDSARRGASPSGCCNCIHSGMLPTLFLAAACRNDRAGLFRHIHPTIQGSQGHAPCLDKLP